MMIQIGKNQKTIKKYTFQKSIILINHSFHLIKVSFFEYSRHFLEKNFHKKTMSRISKNIHRITNYHSRIFIEFSKIISINIITIN